MVHVEKKKNESADSWLLKGAWFQNFTHAIHIFGFQNFTHAIHIFGFQNFKLYTRDTQFLGFKTLHTRYTIFGFQRIIAFQVVGFNSCRYVEVGGGAKL